ncbi:MAG: glycoside hydrolase family 31 protein, partial [Flavobacteriales bacterium]|nr:glycoside hydrolase family 31 protein [Flavobacteriales bacterium]
SKNIGGVEKSKQSENSLELSCINGGGNLTAFNDNIVRVRLVTEGISNNENPYSVVQKPEGKFVIEKKGSEITLSTKALDLVFCQNTSKLTFRSKSGSIINEDSIPVSWIGTEGTVYKKLQEGERFVGLGEKVGPLDRRGTSYTNWNTDKFAYDVEQDPLYLSTPFYIGIHNNLCYGIFLDNTHKTTFNFGASTDRFSWFSAEDGALDYYFIYGNTIAEIIEQYTWLTGRMQMPPKWSLGFQQCRYSYYPDTEVKQLAQTFRDKQIPCDVIYLDIHYMQDYKAFTFDSKRFPTPIDLTKELSDKGFKTVVIVDPGIKIEQGYDQFDTGKEQDVFVKYPDGEYYKGEVWPGESYFPDFTASKTRKWWGEQLKFYTEVGIKGIWNDMNEPAAWGQCLPNNIEFEFESQRTTHREARNVYGMQMARATQEGVKNQLENERPFVLTRAGFSGIQRYSAVWTGDNVSSDEHMMLGVRLLNSMGLTGISFAGNDIGGFAGEATPDLYARWISIGAFQPFFRAHSVVNSRDAEPWCFGEEVEQIARNYTNLRYRLMPYLYSAFYQSTKTGIPVVRSLAIQFPHEEKVFDWNYQHQFMCGDSLLVVPVESTKEFTKVWLPEGNWYDLWTDQFYTGKQEIILECPKWRLPVFVKAGAVIPMQSQVQHLSENHDGNLKLHVYLGDISNSHLYEDDGISYDYQNDECRITSCNLAENQLKIVTEGKYKSDFNTIKLFLHGYQSGEVKVNGIAQVTDEECYRFVQPITGIDTFFHDKGEEMKIEHLSFVEFDNSNEEITIEW